ncbi:MAG: hypothetical protein JSV84_09040 [Gemmatimonadota bacterium]|nr:MAG: hypothetical protein JSV84_09040 [Gemmatimonadota bacterium]
MIFTTSELKDLILAEISIRHTLGEQVGGSGHLGFVSLTNLEIGEPVEIKFKEKQAFEILFSFETYTESEFHYATDDDDSDDMYRSIYHAKIIVDKELKVLHYTNLP